MITARKHLGTSRKRRSAAIVIIDVVGYSRLMERDEEDTIKRWDDTVRSIIQPEVDLQSGRIVRKYTAGDGMLLDFVSPVRAVRCALGIQKAMVEAGKAQPIERRFRLRIGINIVDMVVGRHGLQGHGINVASRVEKMSEADGIIVTAAVHDLVESALVGVTFVDLGRQHFHNMSRPIQVYRVKATDGPSDGAPAARAMAVRSAAAALIAVLPLAGPPGDAEAGSLVDGIRSELIASFTKMNLPTTRSGLWMPGIEVGDPITSQYHHDADIRYTVSGSLRCSGEWFRATVELVETASNVTKWAHTFEGPRTDLFGMEDRVVQGVLHGVEPLLERTEFIRALAKPLEELNSYECVARAVPLLHRLVRRDFMKAAAYLRRAISMDPDNTAALAWYAWWHLLKVGQGWSKLPSADIAEADRLVHRARECNPADPLATAVSGHIDAFLKHDLESARGKVTEALHLNPRSSFVWTRSSVSHSYLGDPQTGLSYADRAIALSRSQMNLMFGYTAKTLAYMVGRDYEKAVHWGQRTVQVNENYTAVLKMLAASLAHAGHIDDARRVVRRIIDIEPNFRLSNFRYPLKRKDDMALYLEGLGKAGVPE